MAIADADGAGCLRQRAAVYPALRFAQQIVTQAAFRRAQAGGEEAVCAAAQLGGKILRDAASKSGMP